MRPHGIKHLSIQTVLVGRKASIPLVCLLVATEAMDLIYEAVFERSLTSRFGPFVPSLAFALAFTALWWCLMVVFRRRGWRIVL